METTTTAPAHMHATPVQAFEVYALRYAHHERDTRENFIQVPAGCNGPMPMDYFVWLLKLGAEAIVVDTGFDAAMAAKRNRQFIQCPSVSLSKLGVDCAQVRQVIITHLHYDHAGNLGLFPHAQFLVQQRELNFTSSRFMAHRFVRLAYEPEHIQSMMDGLFGGRVQALQGDTQLAPGLSLHLLGGHTDGLQVVRVWTAKGWMVLASDATHYYANRDNFSPFPIVFNVGDMIDGFSKMGSLASSPELVIPGHDPLVMQRFERLAQDPDNIVRLA